jgi:hypothetical protein
MNNFLILIICAWSNPTAIAQGLVEFNNNPSTLVTFGFTNTAAISGATGSYYFGLLTSVSGAPNSFTFAGIYATNVWTVPGRFIGGTRTVNGWAPGSTMFYEVAGWSVTEGVTWNPQWLLGNFGTGYGFFGISAVASGSAGGGSPPAPPLPLFGGTGISQGFNLDPHPLILIPEPGSLALAGVGFAIFVVLRLRNRKSA